MPWAQALELVKKSEPGDNLNLSGVYRTISRTPTLRVITKEEGSPAYLIWWMQNKRRFLQRCNPHKTRQQISRCQALTLEEAELLWNEAYEDLAFDQDQHKDVHVIMGPVLKHWSKLRTILGVEAAGGGGRRGRLVMKFVNEVSTDGTRIIGVLVPPEKVFDLEESFTGYSLRHAGGLEGGLPLDDMTLRSGLMTAGGMPFIDDGPVLGPDGLPLEDPEEDMAGMNPDGSWGPTEPVRAVQTLGGAALSPKTIGAVPNVGVAQSLLDASDDDEEGTDADEAEVSEAPGEEDEEEEEGALEPMGTQSPRLAPTVQVNECGEDNEDEANASFNLDHGDDEAAALLANEEADEAAAALLEGGDDDVGVSVPAVGDGGIDFGDIGEIDL
jgi:hypothetical protein